MWTLSAGYAGVSVELIAAIYGNPLSRLSTTKMLTTVNINKILSLYYLCVMWQVNPTYHVALTALKSINIHDIDEVRSFRAPPVGVVLVMEAICLLFSISPPTYATLDENYNFKLNCYSPENISQFLNE